MTLYEIFSAFAEKTTPYEVISVFVSLGALILVLWQIRSVCCSSSVTLIRNLTEDIPSSTAKMPYRAFEDRNSHLPA